MSIKEFQQRLEEISPRLHLNTFEDTGEPSTIILEDQAGEDWVVYHFKGRLFTSSNILILTNTICPQDFDKLQLLINEYWDSFNRLGKTFDKEGVLLGIASDAISALKEMRGQKNETLLQTDH